MCIKENLIQFRDINLEFQRNEDVKRVMTLHRWSSI